MSQYEDELDFINADFDPAELSRDEPDHEWEPEAESDSPQPSRRKVTVKSSAWIGFGHPPGVRVGDVFEDRRALRRAGVHPSLRSGIHGRKNEGAFSVVVSGIYEDDTDRGDTIFYTGTGGLEKPGEGGPQVEDQSFGHYMNGWLLTSIALGTSVRVTRGHQLRSKYAPKEGFRYDGLYKVVQANIRKGRSGRDVCVFELQRVPGQPPIPQLYGSTSADSTRPQRQRAPRSEQRRRPEAPTDRAPVGSSSSTASTRFKDKHAARDAAAMDVDKLPTSSSSAQSSRLKKRSADKPEPGSTSTRPLKRAANDLSSDEDSDCVPVKPHANHSPHASGSNTGRIPRPVRSVHERTARPPALDMPQASRVHGSARPTSAHTNHPRDREPGRKPATPTASTASRPSSSQKPQRDSGTRARAELPHSHSARKPSPRADRRFVLRQFSRHPLQSLTGPPYSSSSSVPVHFPPRISSDSSPSVHAGSDSGSRASTATDPTTVPKFTCDTEREASESVSGSSADAPRRESSGSSDDPIDLDEYEERPRAGSQAHPIVVEDESSESPVAKSDMEPVSVKHESEPMDVDRTVRAMVEGGSRVVDDVQMEVS